jgi:hypothetical protein
LGKDFGCIPVVAFSGKKTHLTKRRIFKPSKKNPSYNKRKTEELKKQNKE